MKKFLAMLVAALAAMSFSSAALAEGSTWGSLQNSPVEDNNVIGTVYAEKSWPLYRRDQLKLSPFVDGTVVFDSKGYDWNNKLTARAGGKLNYTVGSAGVLTLRAGLAYEHLFKPGDSYSEPFLAGEYWFGWGSGTSAPGSSWGVVGNVSPSEKGNVIAIVHVEQGFLARTAGQGKIIPFADLTVARDSKDLAWNNKEVYGLGVKYAHPVRLGAVNIGAKFQHENRASGSDNGVVVFLTYWFPL